MINLLLADLRKYSRTKMIYIIFIVIIVLNLFTVLLLSTLTDEYGAFNGYRLILDSFNPSSNAGLLIYVFAGVLVSQEFSYGTIRNKIIAGHRRWQVYLSMTLSTILVSVILLLLNTAFYGGLGTLILGYGREWDAKEFVRLLLLIGVSTAIYMVFIFLSIFIATLCRNTGLSIIISIFGILLLSISLVLSEFQFNTLKPIQEILSYTPIEQSFRIGQDEFSRKLAIRALMTSPIYYALLTGVGIVIFQKRDIK